MFKKLKTTTMAVVTAATTLVLATPAAAYTVLGEASSFDVLAPSGRSVVLCPRGYLLRLSHPRGRRVRGRGHRLRSVRAAWL